MTGTPIIEARGLTKRFGDRIAVDGIDLQVFAGEAFGFLGPNGAGKTTTLSMLVGLLTPDAGTVNIAGQGAPTDTSVRRLIGIAPQQLSLYEDLTAEENLSFFGRMYGLSGGRLKERVAWGLELAELTERRRHRVRTFSGGMKRRLNLAVSLVHEPRIALLDEPTVGVDPQSRNHLMTTIASLKEKGLTVVLTTHYMEEAARLCDRIGIIDHGRILELDRLQPLVARLGGGMRILAEFASAPEQWTGPGEVRGSELSLVTDSPLESIRELLESEHAFESLQVKHPDLETVFLNLTGRTLRD